MRVLLVGGAGYLGNAIVDLLLSDVYPFNTVVYDSLLYQKAFLRDLDFVLGDVRDEELLLKHLKRSDVVIWLAAIVGDGACNTVPSMAREVNCRAVQFLVEHFTGKIIFTSTCSVYGNQFGLLTEEDSPSPISLYADTKWWAEQILLQAKGPVTTFRLGTLFGASYHRPRLDLVVNSMVVRAVREGCITVHGGGQFRPFLSVYDAASTILYAVTSEATGTFNLCTENISILKLAHRIANSLGNIQVEVLPEAKDLRSYRVSCDKARKLLEFEPIYSLEWGIESMTRLAGKIKDLEDPWFSNEAYLRRVYGRA